MDLKDALKDVDREVLREFCQGLIKDESEGKEGQENKEQVEASENGTTPAESSATYVFVGAHDRSWPVPSGTSIREKAIARQKEQSDA
jgi:hypothetical protein